MKKSTLANIPVECLAGKTVLLRVDFNVPLRENHDILGTIIVANDSKISASIPTIRRLIECDARIVICSHLGRPKGKPVRELSLAPVAVTLSRYLEPTKVSFISNSVGPEVDLAKASLARGEVLLLENLRFHAGEERNDDTFAAQLGNDVDFYVNDAFACCHRDHASVSAIVRHIHSHADARARLDHNDERAGKRVAATCVSGLLLHHEITALTAAMSTPTRPFAALIGGCKVSSKVGVLKALLPKVDKLVIGGAMAFTFLRVNGHETGASIVETGCISTAVDILAEAAKLGVQVILPTDVVIADRRCQAMLSSDANATTDVVPVTEIPAGWMGLDIGPQSIMSMHEALRDCKTVIWNGPMGMFETEPYSEGTRAIANFLATLTEAGSITIVGGGDTVAAVESCGLERSMSLMSTGGGAMLELLQGDPMPGIIALDDDGDSRACAMATGAGSDGSGAIDKNLEAPRSAANTMM